MNRSLRKILTTAACAAALAAAPVGGAFASDSRYVVTPLISNNTMMHPAAHQDTTLLNPWGIAFFPGFVMVEKTGKSAPAIVWQAGAAEKQPQTFHEFQEYVRLNGLFRR